MYRTLAALFACLVIAGAASAQTPARVQNPGSLLFEPSPDHDKLTAYEADIKDAKGVVVQTIAVGKPAVTATGECVVALNVQPISFGSYTIVIRPVAGSVVGPASTPTDVWDRAPGPPTKPRVQ